VFPLVITFDFDNTLLDWVNTDNWNSPNTNEEILDDLIEAKRRGSEVYIVTARHFKDEGRVGPSIQEWLLDEGVCVDGVFFTEGFLKADVLLELGSVLHYDDNLDEIHAAESVGIPTVHVNGSAPIH